MRFAGEDVDHPLVDALVRQFGLHCNRCVQHGFQSQAQFARIGFLRRLVDFLAGVQVIVDRFLEYLSQRCDGLPMKPNDVADTSDVADEQPIFVAVFDPGGVAL